MDLPLMRFHVLGGSVFVRRHGPPLFESGTRVAFAPDPATGLRVARAHRLLASAGIPHPGAARRRLLARLPRGTWLCVPDLPPDNNRVSTALVPPPHEIPLDEPPGDPLLAAILLGLCGASVYHPDRPLVWSETRLARSLRLWAPVSRRGRTS